VNNKINDNHEDNKNTKKPIKMTKKTEKNTAPNPQANTGVHIKLMIVLDPRNLILEKAFFNCCNGIVKNSPYNIRNRNGITKVSAYCSIMSACTNKRPKPIANSMIKVCSLSNVPIKNSPFT